MSSSDQNPAATPASGGPAEPSPPGRPTAVSSQVLDAGARLVQSLKPVRQMKQHACSFALYAHDLHRQMEVHHFVSRLNQDVLQCAVYDSDKPSARLIGVEYIVSDSIFEGLPPDEQRLWHSHAYEVKAGLWTDVGVPESLQSSEMASLAKTYGKLWCTWQVDRGDALPLGAPALMVSPQAVEPGRARGELVRGRDERYRVDSSAGGLKAARVEMDEPEWINPNADYWRLHRKGFAVDVVPAEMKRHAPFPAEVLWWIVSRQQRWCGQLPRRLFCSPFRFAGGVRWMNTALRRKNIYLNNVRKWCEKWIPSGQYGRLESKFANRIQGMTVTFFFPSNNVGNGVKNGYQVSNMED